MKTIKQWLETLPEPYRGQALANMNAGHFERPTLAERLKK